MQISLGGLLLDGTANLDAKYTLEVDGVRGLFGGVGARSESFARSHAHGDYALPVFREARVLTLRGLVHSDGLHAQQRDLSALGAVFADGRRERLTAQSDLGTRWCVVELADEPDIETLVPGRVARYQLTVRARDPRLFGAEASVSGTDVVVENRGSFPASPVVEVSGPRSAPYSISSGGSVFQVTQSLGSGDTHRIDMRSGRVHRNGSWQVGVVARSDLWTVPAYGQIRMAISSGVMTVRCADTYM